MDIYGSSCSLEKRLFYVKIVEMRPEPQSKKLTLALIALAWLLCTLLKC